MLRVNFLFLLLFSFLAVSKEITLQSISQTKALEYAYGSVVLYSESLQDIKSSNYLAIEGWEYKNKQYEYYVVVKINNVIYKLLSTSRIDDGPETETHYTNGEISVTIKTEYFKSAGHESYFIKGDLKFTIGKLNKSKEVFGLVEV